MEKIIDKTEELETENLLLIEKLVRNLYKINIDNRKVIKKK